MITWLILLGYIAGWIFTARKVAWWMNRDDENPDMEIRAAAALLGFIIGMVWPVALLGSLMFMRMPKNPRQLQAEVAERDRRIAQLERELGIGQQR